jgi:hypothetical protein
MSCLKLYLSHLPLLEFFFFHGSIALVGLGLLIFKASWSHSGMDYAGLLYTSVTGEFTSSI